MCGCCTAHSFSPPTPPLVHLYLLCVCVAIMQQAGCVSTSKCHFLAIWIRDVCDRARQLSQTHTHTDTHTYASQRRKAALGKRFASFGGISRLSLADLSPTQAWPRTRTHTYICICHCCCCLWQLVAAVRTVHAITRRMQTPTMPPAACRNVLAVVGISWSGNAKITDHSIYLFL